MKLPKSLLAVRVIVAVIILQTLRFKFTGHPDSVDLFSEVSNFAFGDASKEGLLRVGTGAIELIAGVMLLIPRTVFVGALLTAGTMMGAIMTHVLVIGIVFKEDGGALFGVALLALLGSLYCMWATRDSVLRFLK
ncbi:MauE/DoxX family redox-associated membrane protein [Rubritalea marina]|uniref:MauE/DoxX family redox-associated membrane protein n=1 Tax=Rubritalea marina TaxID=361055 RepID=UPI00037EC5EB|nr:DoxX family membrane protein [Rubritalea marina]